MSRILQTSNIVALVVTILINYLSNTGIFNGNTMSTVSAKYQNLFTPAGYAFSIWGLIYIALAGFVIYQSKGLFGKGEIRPIVKKIGWMFVLSCVANCLWIVAWLYEYTGVSVILMLVLLGSLCTIVLRTRMELDLIPLKQIVFEWWPFAMYLGWIGVALIANTAVYLTSINWNGFGLSDTTWTIVMIFAAVVVNLMLTWIRNLRESAVVGAWGLAAVAVANHHSNDGVYYTALVATIIILISCAIHGYQNMGKHYLK
jgi:hypothetical protein